MEKNMKVVTMDEKKQIDAFASSCDEMIFGKFILADVKISKILKTIADCEPIKDLIKECMINFNFENEFEKAIKNYRVDNTFKLPDEIHKKIAFVFCFLVELDHKHIDFSEFINSYFKASEENGSSYNLFAKTMLESFKNNVLGQYDLSISKENEKQVLLERQREQEEQNKKLVFEKKVKALEEQCDNLRYFIEQSDKIRDSKKELAFMYLQAFKESLSLGNKKVINALATALDDVVSTFRDIRYQYDQFKNVLLDFYS
jgi:hypothetical protein